MKTLFAIASLALLSNIVDNIDYPENELVGFEDGWGVFTAESCCYFCDLLSDCNAFTWTQYDSGRCYFKKFASQPVANNPAPDGSACMRSAMTYKCQSLQPNTDFIGSDLSSSPGMSAEMCCGICRSTSGCTGFSWSEYNGGTCWLKSGVLTAIPGPGMISTQVW